MNNFKVGDKFYFYKNMTDSETIAIGFKGVIDEIIEMYSGRLLYCCDGYGFTGDEIKPVIKKAAILGCKHKLYNIETGLCPFCNEKVV